MAHTVSGELRKAPFVKQLTDSVMFAVELSEVIKDYQTGEKQYTNYKALLFAKSQAHIDYYNSVLVENNFIVVTAEKLKIEVSDCGQYTKLFMDNARLENAGYITQQAPQQQQQYNQAPQQQQGGFAPQQQQYQGQQQGGFAPQQGGFAPQQ